MAKKTNLEPTPDGTSDKEHLVGVIRDQAGVSKATAKQAFDAMMETMALSLKKNNKVQLLGFGTFEVAKRKAHLGRNPATGEQIKIKASKTVRFRAGTKLRASV